MLKPWKRDGMDMATNQILEQRQYGHMATDYILEQT